MDFIATAAMWAFAVAAYLVVSRWNTGKEGDKRQAYWARYEGK